MKRLLFSAVMLFVLAGIITGTGKEIGKIASIDAGKKEIIINVKSDTNLKMGDLLEIETESGKIILEATFPMMTTSKCKIKWKGKLSELSKGMAVYRYSTETENKDELTGKSGETKKFGKIEFNFIAGGTFTMGSPENEKDRGNNETQHRVTLSPFWIGKYEVTQNQYRDVMGANPSYFKGDNLPVETVSWYDAVEYCNKLSEKQGLKPYYKIDKDRQDPNNKSNNDQLKYTVTILGGDGFRLPTEAEWEYACRGGTTTVFHYGNSLDSSMANFNGNYPYNADKKIYREKTTKVGIFKPNAYGLFDMHGNVYEWCWDWYSEYAGDVNDPKGGDSGYSRVKRGGCWDYNGEYMRSAKRRTDYPHLNGYRMGFRLARAAF